jgi:hypothetical protein
VSSFKAIAENWTGNLRLAVPCSAPFSRTSDRATRTDALLRSTWIASACLGATRQTACGGIVNLLDAKFKEVVTALAVNLTSVRGAPDALYEALSSAARRPEPQVLPMICRARRCLQKRRPVHLLQRRHWHTRQEQESCVSDSPAVPFRL